MIHLYLEPLKRHTTYDAEAVGALLGTRLINLEEDVASVATFIDEQTFINSMEVTRPSSGHHLTRIIFVVSVRPHTYHGQLNIV